MYATANVIMNITIENLPVGKTGMFIRLTFGNTQYVDYRVTWATATTNRSDRHAP